MIKQPQRRRFRGSDDVKKYAVATWKGLTPEMKFFLFSLLMLLLSQLWLSHRHNQKALETMGGGRTASHHESSLSRSLRAFHAESHEYTAHRIRLNNTNANDLEQEELQRIIVNHYATPPAWVRQYAAWHGQKMARLTPENWQHQRYLLVRCLASDRQRCGDASHRLMSIPSALLMAHQTDRILLIKWTQPADLENYLVPPTSSKSDNPQQPRDDVIDWRIPDWLLEKFGDLDQYEMIMKSHPRTLHKARDPTKRVVLLRHMTRDNGSSYYNEYLKPGEPQYRLAFRLIWSMMFQPSPEVESLLQANMEALGIQTDAYVTIQVRTLDQETPDKVQALLRSSLDCTATIEPKTQHKIVIASESQVILDAAMDMQANNQQVLGLKTSSSILSLDQTTEEWRNRTKEDYYPAFVYLYILANAKCGSYFDDRDGRWGSLISHNPLCAAVMKWRPPMAVVCDAVDPYWIAPELHPNNNQPASSSKVVVAPDQSDTHKVVEGVASALEEVKDLPLVVDEALYWEPLPEFPQWMNDYFQWHKETRAKLNEENWDSKRYLVFRCLATDEKCGGASDRLQSFLLGILFASLGERLLFIHWERPAPLEEFLLPPKVGLDWRMPDWLNEKLDYDKARMIVTTAFKPVTMNSLLVTMRHQKFWPEFYDERKQDNERTYENIFHDVWQRVFEPSLPVQALTEKTMRDLDIEKGKYVSVHVRAKYFSDKSNDHSVIQNAINCASNLRPGWPIYFASDSGKAVQNALAYGRSVGGKVVAREYEKEPLHLDRADEFLNHKKRFTGYSDLAASNYYDVFVDMYLLANSECVSLGIGGYGRLGSMLSFNRTCSTNYMETQCEWTSE